MFMSGLVGLKDCLTAAIAAATEQWVTLNEF